MKDVGSQAIFVLSDYLFDSSISQNQATVFVTAPLDLLFLSNPRERRGESCVLVIQSIAVLGRSTDFVETMLPRKTFCISICWLQREKTQVVMLFWKCKQIVQKCHVRHKEIILVSDDRFQPLTFQRLYMRTMSVVCTMAALCSL